MKRAFGLICLLTAFCASFAGSATGGSASQTANERLGDLDQQVLAEVNRTRIEHGMKRLVVSNGLQRAAVVHSQQMLDRGFFAHDTPNGAPFAKRVRGYYRSDGYSSWSVGENLLYSNDGITAQMAVEAWLDSPDHRENMLSPAWREIGVAAVRSPVAGGTFGGKATWVITMDFGARSGRASTLPGSTTASRSWSARLRSPIASLATSSRPPARPPRTTLPAKNTTKHSVTRVLPGGRVTQPI